MTAHLDRLLSPPQQVMDRARTAQQTSLLDEIDSELRAARRDWLHACDRCRLKDSTENRGRVVAALNELNALLDMWLETRETA